MAVDEPEHNALTGWSAGARASVQRAIERHGGWEGWRTLHSVTLRPTAFGGLLPWAKGHGRTFVLPPRIDVFPRALEATFFDYPGPGTTSRFERGRLLLDGRSIENHRASFHGLSKLRRWAPEDALYFFGYALTYYHAVPFLLADARLVDHRRAKGGLDAVTVDMPEGVHSHCTRQTFFIDAEGFIRRHDYVAEIAGAWARGCHFWRDIVTVEGVPVAKTRHVTLRLFGHPTPLVALHAEFGEPVVVRLPGAVAT